MTEWFKVHAWNACVRKYREFESHLLRHSWKCLVILNNYKAFFFFCQCYASIRLLIADDDPVVRETLPGLIVSARPDIEVVAVVANGAEAVDVVHARTVDVVLMDVQMLPGLSIQDYLWSYFLSYLLSY